MTDPDHKPERVELDLRPWGYAAGGYSFQCVDCPKTETFAGRSMGAKRSWRCWEHALAASKAEPHPQAPAVEIGGEVDFPELFKAAIVAFDMHPGDLQDGYNAGGEVIRSFLASKAQPHDR